jgi:hypothetical protein
MVDCLLGHVTLHNENKNRETPEIADLPEFRRVGVEFLDLKNRVQVYEIKLENIA